jgi:hypothetical protein
MLQKPDQGNSDGESIEKLSFFEPLKMRKDHAKEGKAKPRPKTVQI